MKKIRLKFIVLLMVLLTVSFLNGCFVDNDKSKAESYLGKVITCLENNDSVGLKNLFSKNKIDESDFESGSLELFESYKGEFVSHNFSNPGVYEDTINGQFKKWFVIGADITTTEEVYRIIMYWCDTDTTDMDNQGIWTLYWFNYKDNPLQDYSFYGNSRWGDEERNGIHIIKAYEYLDMTINTIKSGENEYLSSLFANRILSNQVDNILAQVSNFNSYFDINDFEFNSVLKNVIDTTNANQEVEKRELIVSYIVCGDNKSYAIAVRYCQKDINNSDNIGLLSLYVCESNEYGVGNAYIGDGLWTEGINIGIANA